jgi:hypothetical protein
MDKIVVSGITMYPDVNDQRFRSCARFLERARDADIQVYLVDASSNPLVTDRLRNLATRVEYIYGIEYHAKKASALAMAIQSGAEAVVITELEKDGLVPDLRRICQPILDGTADLVIPKRTSRSWLSYPKEMRETEARIITSRITASWDTLLGAFAISQNVTEHFIDCQELMWAWLHKPRFEIIRQLPDRTTEVEVDFIYPPEQKMAEEGNLVFHLKRLGQLKYTFDPLIAVYGTQ